jgi:hypothetical protein
MMHRNNVHIDKSHPNASGARLPMTLLLLLTLLVAGAHAQTSIMPRKPLNQTTFLVTTPPAMTPQHACIDVEWPELIRNTVETERTAAMLSSNSNSNSNGGELIHRQRTIRVCSRTNRTVSLQSQFEPGALDLDIPAAMQETETDFRGRVELNGGLATFASFTQVYTSLGDVLFVRLSGLSRANRLIAPAFLFVQTYDTPQIQIVYDSPDGSQTPIVVYNQSDVAARRLVVATLPAGVLAADYNFSTDLFAWERGENVTRLAVVTLIAIDPPPIGQSLLVIYMTKYFEGSSTNGIIIGVIFIFIAACCTPCILIYLFACVALCCCGKERYNRIIKRSFGSIKAGGANVDDEGAPKDDATPGCFSRMFACFERNLALAIVGATIAQGVFTIVQLIALIFNIVLIQQGIEFVTNLVPELQELALQLLDKWAVDLLPLFEGIQKITEAFKLALVSVSINCFSARNILAAALCVWMFQFIVIVIRTDAFVRIRHLVSRVSGPIFETIGGMLLTVLALGMQSTLQQTNLLLGRAFAGETLAFDAVGCTDLDTELLPITRPGTIVFIIAVAIAVTTVCAAARQGRVEQPAVLVVVCAEGALHAVWRRADAARDNARRLDALGYQVLVAREARAQRRQNVQRRPRHRVRRDDGRRVAPLEHVLHSLLAAAHHHLEARRGLGRGADLGRRSGGGRPHRPALAASHHLDHQLGRIRAPDSRRRAAERRRTDRRRRTDCGTRNGAQVDPHDRQDCARRAAHCSGRSWRRRSGGSGGGGERHRHRYRHRHCKRTVGHGVGALQRCADVDNDHRCLAGKRLLICDSCCCRSSCIGTSNTSTSTIGNSTNTTSTSTSTSSSSSSSASNTTRG